MKIVTDPLKLRQKCRVVTADAGGRIARKLWSALEDNNNKAQRKFYSANTLKLIEEGKIVHPKYGLGLSAPQIGVDAQVCVINAGQRLSLINPRIVGHGEYRIPFREGCLSLPGVETDTWRYPWVEVESAKGRQTFGPNTWEEWNDPPRRVRGILLAVVVQHEIAHLNGLLITDFAREDYPLPSEWESWKPQ